MEITRCIAKSLIASSTYFLFKYNWKKKTWNEFFGRQSLGAQAATRTCHCNIISQSNHQYSTRTTFYLTVYCRTDVLKYSSLPGTIMEWNKLDVKPRKSESLPHFRNSLVKVGRPIAKPICNIHNLIGLKLLTGLRLGLSHLKLMNTKLKISKII